MAVDLTHEQMQQMAHYPRRKVDDADELTPDEKNITKQTTDAFEPLVHELVVADAKGLDDDTWEGLYDPLRTAIHCEKCAAMTIGAAIAIIAKLAYKLDPTLTRADFVERYEEVVTKAQ